MGGGRVMDIQISYIQPLKNYPDRIPWITVQLTIINREFVDNLLWFICNKYKYV
jgi:hypothetical protein